MLSDIVAHQFWADAELWNAIAAHPPAREDTAIRNRLHHIHQVQRIFTWAIGERSGAPAITRPDDFNTFTALRDYAREAHDDLRRRLTSVSDARIADRIDIPWISSPPLAITVGEALMQMTLHSHYHRGQNATRLREVGGVPPFTDFIFWLWKGRPAPID